MDIICFDIFKNKFIKAGVFNDSKFTKRVSRKKHYFRMFNGYGIENEVVNRLKHLKCKEIIVKEIDTKDSLTVSLDSFLLNSKSYRTQKILNEKYFIRKEDK